VVFNGLPAGQQSGQAPQWS